MDEATLRKAAQVLLVNRATLDAVRDFASEGIPTVVLKGPAIASRLYSERLREYDDVDVLVPPSQFARAEELLERMGYRRWIEEAFPGAGGTGVGGAGAQGRGWERQHHSTDWVKPGHPSIDLHLSFHYLQANPEQVWRALSARTEELELGGQRIQVLDRAGLALVIALHTRANCAQGGELDGRSREDLIRALDQLTLDEWQAAHALARELGAERAFVLGLALSPAGQELIQRLGLRPPSSQEVRAGAGKVRFGDVYLEEFLEAGGLLPRARLAGSMLVPSADWVRSRWPVARHGRRGLALGYVLHAGNVALRVPGAAWRLARKRVLGRHAADAPGRGR